MFFDLEKPKTICKRVIGKRVDGSVGCRQAASKCACGRNAIFH